MTLTQNDVAALAYIGRRIREHALGAPKWDEAGIAAAVRRLADRAYGFDAILDQVVHHARDASAKTPGVIGHPISPRPADETPRGLTRRQQCPSCGLANHRCACDPRARRAPVDSTDPAVRAELAKARELIAAAKGTS